MVYMSLEDNSIHFIYCSYNNTNIIMGRKRERESRAEKSSHLRMRLLRRLGGTAVAQFNLLFCNDGA